MLQGDRRHAGTPEDGVISREQIAQVLVTALSNDAAKNKTFELVAERGEAQQDLTPLFAELRNDNPQKNDGVFEIVHEELCCIILQFMIQRELQQFGVSFTRQILTIANVYSHINY